MWCLPEQCTVGPLWKVLKETNVFQLIGQRVLASFMSTVSNAVKKLSQSQALSLDTGVPPLQTQAIRFKILFKKGSELYVLAVASEFTVINEHWAWLEHHLFPTVDEIGCTGLQSQETSDLVFDCVCVKVHAACMAENPRNCKLNTLFGLRNKTFLGSIKCVLFRHFFAEGVLHIAYTHICFYSPLLPFPVVVAFEDICDIDCHSKALTVTYSHKGARIILEFRDSPHFEDELCWQLHVLWKECGGSAWADGHTEKDAGDELMRKDLESQEYFLRKGRKYASMFCLPPHNEFILKQRCKPRLNGLTLPTGWLVLLQSFVCFFARGDNCQKTPSHKIVIPLSELRDLTLATDLNPGRCYVLTLITFLPLNNYEFILKDVPRVDAMKLQDTVMELWQSQHQQHSRPIESPKHTPRYASADSSLRNTADADDFVALTVSGSAVVEDAPKPLMRSSDTVLSLRDSWASGMCGGFTDAMLADEAQFQPIFSVRQADLTAVWEDYMERFGGGMGMVENTDVLRDLLYKGIPNCLRGFFWAYFSGGMAHAYAYFNRQTSEEYYTTLDTLFSNQRNSTTDEIDKDLRRTFPEHTFFNTHEGLESLRRVLTAYAFHNPKIGYCQSMNMLAALLLIYMTERGTFWTLVTVCELYFPETYTSSMLGSLVDMEVFKQLVKEMLWRESEHMLAHEVDFWTTIQSRSMCFYLGYLPLEITLRVLDVFFFEGTDFLYAVGLTVIDLLSNDILRHHDTDSIWSLLQCCPIRACDTEAFMQTVRRYMDEVRDNMQTVSRMKMDGRVHVMASIKTQARQRLLRAASARSAFHPAELDRLLARFEEEQEKIGLTLTPVGFCNVMADIVGAWARNRSLLARMFLFTDKGNKGGVEFGELCDLLVVLCHGSVRARMLLLLEVYALRSPPAPPCEEIVLDVFGLVASLYGIRINTSLVDLAYAEASKFHVDRAALVLPEAARDGVVSALEHFIESALPLQCMEDLGTILRGCPAVLPPNMKTPTLVGASV